MTSLKSSILCFFLALSLFGSAFANNNGLGRRPPMGWNTWCSFGPCEYDYCNEAEIQMVADAMVDSGMADVGWTYINLDDCWADGRDADGNIYPDSDRFPNGMKATIDYVHSKNLKFGLYTDAGTETCSTGLRNHTIPGSYGHYQQDADTYAGWGVDFVKMDWCNTNINGTQLDPRVQYPQMSSALNASGRPIFFASCEWGVDNPWEWASPYMNSWRTGPDHEDNWKSTADIIERNANLSQFAGPGGWNDPDFLMTGGQKCAPPNNNETCPGQTEDEYITELSLWSIMAAPMIVATSIVNMSDWKLAALTNTEVIAVSQDRLGVAGGRTRNDACVPQAAIGACQVWYRELANSTAALGLYNSDDVAHNISITFGHYALGVRDLWSHKDLGYFEDTFMAEVNPHGTRLFKLTTPDGSPVKL